MATSIIDLNDPERRKVTTHASYQIERMLEVILIAACDDDTEPLPYLLRGIVPRLLELNSVVMSSSGDSGEDITTLKSRLSGGWLPQSKALA